MPVHQVRSIAPDDADFADLDFLRQEIGAARVVMLGEPTHGEGNVTTAKIRLMRYLKEQMGFTTVAFESGFYELDRAQRDITAGMPVGEALQNSVFSIWTSTREFSAIVPLLGPKGLRVAGFDSQFSGDYQDELLEELQAFVRAEAGAKQLQWDLLDECFSSMGEHFHLSPVALLPFNQQVGKLRTILSAMETRGSAAQRARATFWLQLLRSTQAMARDYAQNNSSDKGPDEFKATDSNPRDAQMADNLLWYLRQHPQEKVICWGALPHLSNRVQVLENPEIRTYRPMGQLVKAALGDQAVYVLGTLAGGGTYGYNTPVPPPAAGTLEADLLASQRGLQFISLKHDAPGRALTTYAFEYKPLTGPWGEVVDGFLFLPAVQPPNAGVWASTSAADTAAPAKSRPSAPRPVLPSRRAAAASALGVVSGVVLDANTQQPVPFATVAVPARGVGVVADAQGRFRLPAKHDETVQVSCLGYETSVQTAPVGGSFTVRLQPAAYALAAVRVSARSQNPKRIMKRVIKAAETNYEQQDYHVPFYGRVRTSNFDTLRQHVEYLADVAWPSAYRHWAGGFLMLEQMPVVRYKQKHVLAPASAKLTYRQGNFSGQGFSVSSADPVRVSPLFKMATLGRFHLTLDSIQRINGEEYYVLRFAAKRANHRSTGTYLQAGYAGRVYVRQQDYAVTRFEAQWLGDTLYQNAVARKHFGRHDQVANLYSSVYTDERTAQLVTYQRTASGRYAVATNVCQQRAVGRILVGNKPFFIQSTAEMHLEAPQLAPISKAKTDWQEPGRTFDQAPDQAEFWDQYSRPVSTEAAPALQATKP